MKYILLSAALLFCSAFSFAQDIPQDNNSIKIKVLRSIKKTAVVDEITIPIISPKPVILSDIKADHWDTTVYNPYKNENVEFPIKLQFDDSTYASPILKKKIITSRYGWRRGRAHKGIDIDLVTGDSVVSVLDGIVRFAKYSSGHGKTVVVRHFNGLETTYAHLSKISVKANDTIFKGELLGKGGNTGNSRGSHLHLNVSYKGEFIHPEYIFDFSQNNAIRAKELWVTKKWTRPVYHNSHRVSKVNVLESEEAAIASLIKQRKVYIIKPGDTLSRISKRNNVSIAAICRSNAIKKNTTLRIGQKLILEL